MRWIVIVAVTTGLAACNQKGEETYYQDLKLNAEAITTEAPPAADAAAMAPAGYYEGSLAKPAPPAEMAGSPAPAMIAYEYGYSLTARHDQVRGMMSRHEARCRSAGAAICQVIGSRVMEEGDARLHGELELRAAPQWTADFRKDLAQDVAKSDGRIVDSRVESEDLSRTIIDTDARLRAMTTLRDRLQTLLDTRPGKLADLIEIERELARVQGEIDAAQSQLAHDRGRVATSKITLDYESRSPLARDTVWSPLADAFGDFVELMVGVVAFLIRAIAVLIPLAAIGWLLAFLFRKPLGRWREARRQKKSQKLALRKAQRALTRRRWPV
jgi:hypothetical protein